MTRMWLFALALILAGHHASAQDAAVGMIKTVKGTAQVVRGPQQLVARPGDRLYQGDRLETGDDGALGITFVDDTTLSLGPGSQITLTEFVFQPNAERYAFMTNIVKGTFMFVTGAIGKLAPQSVAVDTPTGTIGIRGTRFLVKVEP
jgi:hypothetical protein